MYYSPFEKNEAVEVAFGIVGDLPKATLNAAKRTVDELYENWETALILMLAVIGVAYLIKGHVSKIPFPIFIEKKMVAPVIAVLVIRALGKSAERRVALCG